MSKQARNAKTGTGGNAGIGVRGTSGVKASVAVPENRGAGRERLRALVQTLAMLAFPVTLNFMSPYVIVDGAFQGIVTGSALLFVALLLSAPFLGRAWCSWLCPAGAIQDLLARTRPRRFGGDASPRADLVKYLVWAVWMGTIVFAFARAGMRAIDPLHLTASGISVDEPARYIIYFGVIAIFMALALIFGKRAGCHTLCWMAPFMVAGRALGRLVRLPGLMLHSEPGRCISCGACAKVCPMSLDAGTMARKGRTERPECIQCGLCTTVCPTGTLDLRFGKPPALTGKRKPGRS